MQRLGISNNVARLLLFAGAVCFLWLASREPAWAQLPGGYPKLPWPRKAAAPPAAQAPHPAVARIIVPEREGATSYGSGTLVDVRDRYALVVTNWHVVRDAADQIEVVFPNGYRSFARALKFDRDWDLAALVIWRPEGITPVPLATVAPKPGDVLTIAGYGRGTYRAVTGQCTQYLAPGVEFPREMVEVSVEARQGDSGGPIFNQQGELAGVLWGAGKAATLGSYVGRVGGFLTTISPDLGQQDSAIAANAAPSEPPGGRQAPLDGQLAESQLPVVQDEALAIVGDPTVGSNANTSDSQATDSQHGVEFSESINLDSQPMRSEAFTGPPKSLSPEKPAPLAAVGEPAGASAANTAEPKGAAPATLAPIEQPITWEDIAGETFFEQTKTVLAAIGAMTVLYMFLRNFGG